MQCDNTQKHRISRQRLLLLRFSDEDAIVAHSNTHLRQRDITSRMQVIVEASLTLELSITLWLSSYDRFVFSTEWQQQWTLQRSTLLRKTGGLELGVGNIYGVIDNMAGLYAGYSWSHWSWL